MSSEAKNQVHPAPLATLQPLNDSSLPQSMRGRDVVSTDSDGAAVRPQANPIFESRCEILAVDVQRSPECIQSTQGAGGLGSAQVSNHRQGSPPFLQCQGAGKGQTHQVEPRWSQRKVASRRRITDLTVDEDEDLARVGDKNSS
ncbi:hypothetical protein RRF57_007899 [Xylaria bambusicola]|uniref:Uncharacterized protein n=1 Tax=Xylaria bambusicola TaxID=326684 RepID=A0AAN7UGW6_9PEZI